MTSMMDQLPLIKQLAIVKNELINMIKQDAECDAGIKPILIKTIEDADYFELEDYFMRLKKRKLRNPTH